jgi:hypothetical protein
VQVGGEVAGCVHEGRTSLASAGIPGDTAFDGERPLPGEHLLGVGVRPSSTQSGRCFRRAGSGPAGLGRYGGADREDGEGEQGQGERGQGGVPVPADPAADLVVVEPDVGLWLRDGLLDHGDR